MLGLFGTLNLGTRSLQTQQTGVEVTGQNLANVNNPAYARQRVQIQTSLTIPSAIGPMGTGAQAVGIQQLRDVLLDGQIRSEQSVGGYWASQQSNLQNAQVNLGEFLDRQSNVNGTSATSATSGLSGTLNSFFNAFGGVATAPTSLTARQTLVSQAQTLTNRFHDISQRLGEVQTVLRSSIDTDIGSANTLLTDIAKLNDLIAKSELPLGGKANDLRDLREAKLESLTKLVNIETTDEADGSVSISIGGTAMVTGNQQVDSLESYAGGQGQLYLRAATAQTNLTPTGGSIAGAINLQDNEILALQNGINTLASSIISQVNALHSPGYDLAGNTGQNFFTGTGAADMAVNVNFITDPSQIQAAGVANATGDNSVALALAQLKDQPIVGLGNQTLSNYYGKVVGDFGQALSGANTQVANHQAVQTALLKQRDSVSGVSIDEEMTNLITYQKAYQASAKIVTTVDEMLDTILNMKR
ncbi:MAG: flagellar hook-associated protein FlgK [Akkermansiaceae bacterium]|nr:flagellar hook-associated protein FlgK [Verrucomicrobiales bacterium]